VTTATFAGLVAVDTGVAVSIGGIAVGVGASGVAVFVGGIAVDVGTSRVTDGGMGVTVGSVEGLHPPNIAASPMATLKTKGANRLAFIDIYSL
jgi:hypothetical protein